MLSIQKDSGRPLLFPVSPGRETTSQDMQPGSSELATPAVPQQEEVVGGPSPAALVSSKVMNLVADGDLPFIN